MSTLDRRTFLRGIFYSLATLLAKLKIKEAEAVPEELGEIYDDIEGPQWTYVSPCDACNALRCGDCDEYSMWTDRASGYVRTGPHPGATVEDWAKFLDQGAGDE